MQPTRIAEPIGLIDITDIMRRQDAIGVLCRAWDECRPGEAMPSPDDLRNVFRRIGFSNYVIICTDLSFDYSTFEEVGVDCQVMFGNEIEGTPFFERLQEKDRPMARRALGICMEQPCGLWADYTANWSARGRLSASALILPLSPASKDRHRFAAAVFPKFRKGEVVQAPESSPVLRIYFSLLNIGYGTPVL